MKTYRITENLAFTKVDKELIIEFKGVKIPLKASEVADIIHGIESKGHDLVERIEKWDMDRLCTVTLSFCDTYFGIELQYTDVDKVEDTFEIGDLTMIDIIFRHLLPSLCEEG